MRMRRRAALMLRCFLAMASLKGWGRPTIARRSCTQDVPWRVLSHISAMLRPLTSCRCWTALASSTGFIWRRIRFSARPLVEAGHGAIAAAVEGFVDVDYGLFVFRCCGVLLLDHWEAVGKEANEHCVFQVCLACHGCYPL